jgi:hypothetical protein
MTHTTITKISLKKGKPTIVCSEVYAGGAATASKSIEGREVAEDIIAAMAGLLDTLIEACVLADGWEEGEITGLTIKPVEAEYGVVITGQLRVECDVPYVVVCNSPYLNPERLTQSEQMAIKRILVAAADYLNSLPEQLELLEAAVA